ncbi:MAG: DUF4363 family protein [Clostridia bacterium]|nr:DUF4363 family protein [Clostridia bacterium]
MYKETIICIITVIMIIAINTITENYTSQSVKELNGKLEELKKEISKEERDINVQFVKEKVTEIYKTWDDRYNILTYYLEHNELEKVENNLTVLKSYLESDEYAEASAKLDEMTFVLHHIEEKNKLDLKNVF